MKEKKCIGTGKAKGYGCQQLSTWRKYGLCPSCFGDFLFGSSDGKIILEKTTKKAKNNVKRKRVYTKWTDKSFSEMIKHVQFKIVNPYIRKRDIINFNRCISSNNSIVDAGHYYPTTVTQLRFCIMNIHGQNHSDNRFRGGNVQAYKEGLINRHGLKYFKTLEKLKTECNHWPRIDKIELIKIGKTYEHLNKNNIWCFDHNEFENYKNIINS